MDEKVAQVQGERLIATTIDLLAKEQPQKVYACVPRDDDDISKGFIDVTYRQFANAINHASWWLDSVLGSSDGKFESFAYAGPKDLSWPVMAVAAAKVGRTILLPSPYASTEAQLHLLNVTGCKAFVHAEDQTEQVRSLVAQIKNVPPILVPGPQEWFYGDEAPIYEYKKSWDEAKLDPWIIFHTSGTTGLPKPIIYNNLMMTSVEANLTMSEAKEKVQSHHYIDGRLYSPLPSLHFVGMCTVLSMPVLLGTVFILGPFRKPATPKIVDQILRYGKVTVALLPPYILEDLANNPDTFDQLKKLNHIHYAGAPLNEAAGDKISQHVKLHSALGSTETGPWFSSDETADPSLWSYHKFCPSLGLQFESRSNNMYEPVFYRKEELKRWQQVFYVFPDLTVFPTKDLMTKHPTKPDFWKYAGRTDDLVLLSLGVGVHASKLESIITTHPDIRSAIIGGNGRKRPFLLLEMDPELTKAGDVNDLERVWPAVMKANEQNSDISALTKELTIFMNPSKPFSRTAKGTVSKKDTIASYQHEIDALYDDQK